MVLTDRERDFLAAFLAEATTDPFTGPATEELHRRDIYYSDVPHLLAAYYQQSPPDEEGLGGKPNARPPRCPWKDRDRALQRDREAGAALESAVHPTTSASQGPRIPSH